MTENTILQQTRVDEGVILADTLNYSSLDKSTGVDSVRIEKITQTSTSINEFRHEGVHSVFSLGQAESVFGLLLVSFLIFAYIYNNGASLLKENMALLFSPQKMQRVHRQTTTSEILYSYFLIFQAVILVSVSFYDVFSEKDISLIKEDQPLPVILSFSILIAFFIIFKVLVYKLLGYIFDRQREMFIWQRTTLISFELLGLLFFIPTLFLVYAGVFTTQIVIFMAILFLIVQIALFFQVTIFFVREKFNFLYLIAYLCTFEILPYIFLYLGLVYLYKIDISNVLWL